MKKIISIILTAALLITMPVSAFADGIDGPKKAKITVGINAGYEPFEYYENDVLTGFDIDLMKCIGEEIGYDIEFVDMAFDALIPSVAYGRIDCALSAVTMTEEREMVVDFSTPYLCVNIKDSAGHITTDRYAVVFPDGLSEAVYQGTVSTEKEKLYLSIEKAIGNLIHNNTVQKLMETYHLDYGNDTDGYSYEYFTSATYVTDTSFGYHGDSEPSDWAAESVEKAAALNITDKDKSYTYTYAKPITREGFCELIYNLIGAAGVDIEDSRKDFKDTDNKKIAALFTMGIINEKTETEFAPYDLLTREEAAAIIIRMVNKLFPMAATEMWFEYEDIDEISDWASDSVQIISNLGFMKGVGNNEFAPKAAYTTEQAIATLVRVYNSGVKNGFIPHGTNTGTIGGVAGPSEIVAADTIEVDDLNKEA
ncbi:MAG: transporter substrate-binding domain-containing protein [Clostridia bacterium]|nr:transporter substrate-binding domain-containing protein [Clostridia bacterium]